MAPSLNSAEVHLAADQHADAPTLLSNIVELLSAFAKTNSKVKFTKLLNGLQLKIEEFRESPQKRKRRSKDLDKTNFNGAAPRQSLSNVVTRSQPLVLRNEATPTPTLLVNTRVGRESPGNEPGSAVESPSEPAPIANETPPADANTKTDDECFEMDRQDLAREVERCKERFRGETFFVSGDGYSETVIDTEIDGFFSRFGEDMYLSNFNLMPLIFSFDWPSTTLLLNSTCLGDQIIRDGGVAQKHRWSLNAKHHKLIIPYCSDHHWTLLEVDLTRQTVRQYNSRPGVLAQSVIAFIEERIATARGGLETINLTAEPVVRFTRSDRSLLLTLNSARNSR